MSLDEISMGHAALAVASVLSPDELGLVHPGTSTGSDAHQLREDLELRLYYHLDCARRARMEMDSARSWSDGYENRHRDRELALERASRAYRQLQDLGGVPGDLAEMALSEGLAP